MYNGLYQVPTFQDDIDQARTLSVKYHRPINLVPEIKHSTTSARSACRWSNGCWTCCTATGWIAVAPS